MAKYKVDLKIAPGSNVPEITPSPNDTLKVKIPIPELPREIHENTRDATIGFSAKNSREYVEGSYYIVQLDIVDENGKVLHNLLPYVSHSGRQTMYYKWYTPDVFLNLDGWYSPTNQIQFTLNGADTYLATEHHPDIGKYDGIRMPFFEVTYDIPRPRLSNLRVRESLIDPMKPITLEWDYKGVGDGTQEEFMLEYRVGNEEPVKISEETSRQSYTIPARTLPESATIYWKLTVIDSTYNTQSDSQESFFRTIGVKPYVRGLTPNGGVVSSRNPITLSWNHNSSVGGVQVGFILEYKADNEDWTTIEEETSRQSYTIPGLEFTGEQTVTWRVKTIDSAYENESDFAQASFTTGVTAQRPPVITAPFGEYLDTGDVITLEWIFMGHPGELQAKYEVNWSRNNGITWSEIERESINNYHIVEGNSFPTGTITWRVRTYNQYDEVSPWSDLKTFYLIGRPATPVITSVTNYSKPTVRWTSDSQQVYELEILRGAELIYSSGRIASVSTFEHYVDQYLPNGSYRARLRVKNRYDLWSDYGEVGFSINRANPPIPNITVENGEFKVTIRGSGLSNRSYVYREGALLGEMIGGVYEDYTGANNKEYNYFIRTINEEENFSDSINASGKCSFKGNTLALVSSPKEFMLLRFNLRSKPGKISNIGNRGAFMEFDGRDYPSYEFSDMKTFTKDLTFSIKEENLVELERLMDGKGPLIFRDYFGENTNGIVERINATRVLGGYTIDFTINKVKKEV